MPARRSGRATDYNWTGTFFKALNQDIATGVGTAIAIVSFNSRQTLYRVRGQVFASLDPGAADEFAIIGLGMIIVTDDAIAAGKASVPDPVSDPEAGWLWYGMLSIGASDVTTNPGAAEGVDRLVIDTKAMRKVRDNESLVFVQSVGSSNDQAGTYNLLAGLRVLTGV